MRRADPADPRRFRQFAWGMLGYTVVVILWGAYVRATGSGAGCGAHWPSCRGEVVPRDPAIETWVEYTHRVTSGLAWVLALALVVWAWRAFRPGHVVRKGAAGTLVLMSTEALIGAGLVLFELVAQNDSIARAAWMGAHLINTFLLIGALALTAWWASGRPPPRVHGQPRMAWLMSATIAGMLVLGVSGAVTALGDTLFPADSLEQGLRQDLSPSAHLFVRLRVWHPVLGLAVGALVLFSAGVTASARSERSVRRLAIAVAVLFVVQVGIGFVNVALAAPVWMQLLHLLVADVTWLAVVLLAATTLAARGESEPLSQSADAASAGLRTPT